MKGLVVAMLVSALCACGRPSGATATAAIDARQCEAALPQATYFPASAFDVDARRDELNRVYYGEWLQALRKPSLLCGDDTETIRLLHVPWTGSPVSVRLVKTGRTAVVSWTMLESPAWHWPPGPIVRRGEQPVPRQEWDATAKAVEDANFWSMTANRPKDVDGPGAVWLIEARQGRRYHVAVRLSPPDGSYLQLGVRLMELAGVTESQLRWDGTQRTRPYLSLGAPPPPPPDSRPRTGGPR